MITYDMKFARLKKFATSTALAVSIVFSFGMGMPASAMTASQMDGMAHENTSVNDCINQHHISPGAVQKVTADEPEDKDDEPTPNPVPYFVQFQTTHSHQKQATPDDITLLASFRPPDILRLTSNIRF